MSLQDDITRLVKPVPAAPRLDAAVAPPAIREQTGLERVGRGGRADVQTEEITATSTDGIFTFVVRVLLG